MEPPAQYSSTEHSLGQQQKRVAVVIGSDKGIGLSIVKELCKKFDGTVYLTAPNTPSGLRAIANLRKEGYNPHFHQIDVTDQDSIDTLVAFIAQKYGGLDVIVNNAAIIYKKNATEVFAVQAVNTIRVNFTGIVNVCRALFPLLRPHARVVNMSTAVGMLVNIPSPALRERFTNPNLTEEELCQLIQEFVDAAQIGKHLKLGWGGSAFVVSKVGVMVLSHLQQKQFLTDEREDIIVNAVHPGYAATQMSRFHGPLTLDQGAQVPCYLALLPPNVTEPKGQMVWDDKRIVNWKTI